MYRSTYILFMLMVGVMACNSKDTSSKSHASQEELVQVRPGTFQYDLNFLKQYHPDLVVLSDSTEEAQVIVLPAYQGRVMTSTAEGGSGKSFGWINHEFIASGKPAKHINVYGGEERIWLGPEGGQFSIYFKKGSSFNFDNWYVPAFIDTEAFEVIRKGRHEVHLAKETEVLNYSGTKFNLKIERHIQLLSASRIQEVLGLTLPESVQVVGFESNNSLQNKGTQAWTKKGGLLSIWILSMLNAAPGTIIAIPYREGEESALGKIVTDDYFGKVPAERLKVDQGLILFKADAKYRSKIGLSPQRALPLAASWDPAQEVLTIAQFELPEKAQDYVNSLWEMQKEPFSGDAVNAYNDGPNDTGAQLGAFYEIESSSPGAVLKPGAKLSHFHRTIHLKGKAAELDAVAQALFGKKLAALSL